MLFARKLCASTDLQKQQPDKMVFIAALIGPPKAPLSDICTFWDVSTSNKFLAFFRIMAISKLRFFELSGNHFRQVVKTRLGDLECKEWGWVDGCGCASAWWQVFRCRISTDGGLDRDVESHSKDTTSVSVSYQLSHNYWMITYIYGFPSKEEGVLLPE